MFMMNRSRHRGHDMMDEMMESKIFRMVAVGALVWVGAKAIQNMMED